MTRIQRCLVILVTILGCTHSWRVAPAEDSSPGEGEIVRDGVGRRMAEFVSAAHQSYGFNGVVLAARDGQVQCAIAVGNLDEESEARLKTTTLFEIASATKPITAMTALKLEERGRLSLDDPISKHLPGLPDDCRGITIRHLIQHTSGIPGTNTRGGKKLAQAVPMFLRGGPQHPPGIHWEYWNQGYSLLSEIIARASGQSTVDF